MKKHVILSTLDALATICLQDVGKGREQERKLQLIYLGLTHCRFSRVYECIFHISRNLFLSILIAPILSTRPLNADAYEIYRLLAFFVIANAVLLL